MFSGDSAGIPRGSEQDQLVLTFLGSHAEVLG